MNQLLSFVLIGINTIRATLADKIEKLGGGGNIGKLSHSL